MNDLRQVPLDEFLGQSVVPVQPELLVFIELVVIRRAFDPVREPLANAVDTEQVRLEPCVPG